MNHNNFFSFFAGSKVLARLHLRLLEMNPFLCFREFRIFPYVSPFGCDSVWVRKIMMRTKSLVGLYPLDCLSYAVVVIYLPGALRFQFFSFSAFQVARNDPCEVCVCMDGEIFCYWRQCSDGKCKTVLCPWKLISRISRDYPFYDKLMNKSRFLLSQKSTKA